MKTETQYFFCLLDRSPSNDIGRASGLMTCRRGVSTGTTNCTKLLNISTRWDWKPWIKTCLKYTSTWLSGQWTHIQLSNILSLTLHFASFPLCPCHFLFFTLENSLVTLHMILHKYINLHFLTPSPHLHVHPLLPCQKARSFEVSSALWGGTSTLLQGNEEVHLHTEPVQRRQRSRGGAYLQHHDWQECLWVPHHLQESRGSL